MQTDYLPRFRGTAWLRRDSLFGARFGRQLLQPLRHLRETQSPLYCACMKCHSCLVAFLFATAQAVAAEAWWPQFRGLNCSGVSETARPPSGFGPGTNQLWKEISSHL